MALRRRKKTEEVQEEPIVTLEQPEEQNENKEQLEINNELNTDNIQNDNTENQEQNEDIKVEEPKQVQMQSLEDFLF